jgi:two-component system nitrogen regulation sensor histidine kinase NtrY
MADRRSKYMRPALWGFFICIAGAAVLSALRLLVPAMVAQRWDSDRQARQVQIERVIREKFHERIDDLFDVASAIARDSSLMSDIASSHIAGLRAAFQRLESHGVRDDLTLDLVGPEGDVLAWVGPSIASSYGQIIGPNQPQRLVRVARSGLRTVLTAGMELVRNQAYLLASEPLETNYPISNRFIRKVSFCADLSEELDRQVEYEIGPGSGGHPGTFAVPVDDDEGKCIITFFVSELSLDNKIAIESESYANLAAVFFACGSCLLAFICLLWTTRHKERISIPLMGIFCVWMVRAVWRMIDFPGILVHGWLFSPNLYAAPFVLGLSSSPGELILSTTAAALTAWLLLKEIVIDRRGQIVAGKFAKRAGVAAGTALLIVVALLVFWIFRGFGESMRSFVFDSTIRYRNPSEIIPGGVTMLMHLAVLCLGFAVLGVSAVLVWLGKSFFSARHPQAKIRNTVVPVVVVLCCIPVFIFLDHTPQVPSYSYFVLVAVTFLFIELIDRWQVSGAGRRSQQLRAGIWLVFFAFALAEPVVYDKLQQKGHKGVEDAAKDLLRPSDSWLTYVVLDGLRLTASELSAGNIDRTLSTAKENNLAFVLWTKTLLGQEGYNSALVIYDSTGNECDRFVVGLNKPEQKAILGAVFEGEEEAIHVVSPSRSEAPGKLYGAWTTVRDSSGQLKASIAVLLSERQRTVFGGGESEPLRQLRNRFESTVNREIAVDEFRNDTLVFSTGKELYPERLLPVEVDSSLHASQSGIVWKDFEINNHATETVFVRDSAFPGKIIGISLEKRDYRWNLFYYLKSLFVYLGAAITIGLIFLAGKRKAFWRTIGFRGRLFAGFSCITLLPLVILGYYNRHLAAEKVNEQVQATLYHELDQLQDRIKSYVVDREDFIHGVDDDFCEALSAEYGIDFSVYRGSHLQASSRSELYRTSILNRRLNGEAYASVLLGGDHYFLTTEKIGSVDYVVGYSPISINGDVVGVLSIPTLNRQSEIEAELAQRNAYVFGIYAVVFGLALASGAFLVWRFGRPLRELSRAAAAVSNGNLDVAVNAGSQDEIGELAQSFNDMVTKLKESRNELAKHERESAWKEMAKQVAHEIRNPLTPIKLSMQHVRQAFKDNAPEREEILERVIQTVIEQIETLSRIALEFSNFAKLPENKYERVEIGSLLRETINLFTEVRDIEFVLKLWPQPLTLLADRDKLRGVFVNIVKNAIQAIEGKGSITLETMLENRACIVRIADTGPGISDEVRSKIFEPNFSTKSEGMGLGLAIAKRVIEEHGGRIECSSERGKGTTFEIRLPA